MAAYVTLVDNKYTFEDPVKAVETAFLIYWALNIEYPEESKVVWTFVQKYIFGLSTIEDLNKPSIKSVYKLIMEN